MNNTKAISGKRYAAKALTAFIAVAAAVILPQIFHAAGVISGTGAAIGSALLPMHIPVLLAGFLGGPLTGLAAGILSPVVSSAISGMPAAAVLPFMIAELGVYGLASGLLSGTKLNSFVKLIITQIAGRAARAAAMLAAIYLFGSDQLSIASIGSFITAGLFGIMLQWALIPLLADRMEGMKKLYE